MGADRPGRPAEGDARLSPPPIGRVYGRRRGRRLTGQKSDLLDLHLGALSVAPPPAAQVDPLSLFEPRPSALWLEIGFGGGEHLAAQAALHPEIGFIGCEPFLNGVSNLLLLVEQGGLKNVRVVAEDARLLLLALPEASVGRVFLLFPDPWPKRRHEDRRFLSPQGLDLVARVLADGGELRVATDHQELGRWMQDQAGGHSAFSLVEERQARPDDWPPTRYESKALRAGRTALYLTYARRARAPKA